MSSTDPKCMKNSFQIEDIAKIIPMLKGLLLDCWSFELLLHLATINIGMMFAISSIWKSFVPLKFFVIFCRDFFLIKSIEHWRPDPGDPPKRGVQKYLRPGPASIPFSNRRYWYYFPKVPITSQKKTRKSRFQIEDIGIIFQKSQKKDTEIPFSNEVPITSPEKRRKFRFQIEDIDIIFQRLPSQAKKKRKSRFQIEDIAKIIPMLKGLLLDCWSFELLLHLATINIGMMFAISSIWKSFVPLNFFVIFCRDFFLNKINRTLTPRPGWPPEEGSAKVPSAGSRFYPVFK